jgi:hypothetical protein
MPRTIRANHGNFIRPPCLLDNNLLLSFLQQMAGRNQINFRGIAHAQASPPIDTLTNPGQL